MCYMPMRARWHDARQVGARKLYHGSADCLMRTFRNEGAAGLYKGVLISSAGVIPYLTISFAAYEDLKASLPSPYPSFVVGFRMSQHV
jgi:hypothetical protein